MSSARSFSLSSHMAGASTSAGGFLQEFEIPGDLPIQVSVF